VIFNRRTQRCESAGEAVPLMYTSVMGLVVLLGGLKSRLCFLNFTGLR